jgi:ankyrin repeat protein
MDAADRLAAWVAATDLLSNGSDVNSPQRGKSSVLHGAVLRKSLRLVKLALRKGANVEARDERGWTPVALAEELGWEAGFALLKGHRSLPRDHRASRFAFDVRRRPVNRPDMAGLSQELQSKTTGSSHARLATVRELVQQHPRLVFSISTDDELAIEAAAHMGNRDIMNFHLEHGSPMSLPTAVSLGDAEHARFLLDEDPDLIHERGAHDFPVMMFVAFGGGSPELAAALHDEYGVALDQESAGTTALHWSIFRDRYQLAEWLIDNGANLDAVGYQWQRAGETPLAVARRVGDSKYIQLLQRAGARG